MKILSIGFIIVCVFIDFIQANIRRIPSDYSSIQAGVNAAVKGDTVLIAPGVYFENIDLRGKGIVVGSLFLLEEDTSYIAATIIDGAQKGSVLTFASEEDSTTRFVGITVRNGSGTLRNYSGVKPFLYGGGIFCENASPILEHLIVTDNHSAGGGGIFLKNSTALLRNLDIQDNTTLSPVWEAPNVGGGVLLWDSSPEIYEVNVSNNQCEIGGGGIYLLNSSPVLRNLSVTDNSSLQWGGGFFCETNSEPIFMNITIANNEATSDGGGIAVFNNVNLILANTILWYNSPEEIYALPYQLPNTITVTYSNIQGGLPGIPSNGYNRVNWLENNINVVPKFVDMEASNYRLQSSSPCIDAGTDFLIIENDTLLAVAKNSYNGKAPDLGRFESSTIAIEPKVSYRSTSEQMILKNNYPNPFNPSTTIEFNLPEAATVKLTIYNALGQEVATLVNGHLSAGQHRFTWQAKDLPSGTYFYRLSTSLLEGGLRGVSQTRMMLLMK